MKLLGSLTKLVSILFSKDGQDITFRPNQATTYTAARDMQMPPGDASDTVVGQNATQTLTGKTIDGASNTLSNIPVSSATGTLPVTHGGTNSTAALNNNRVVQSSGGALVEAAAITAARALISDVNGIPTQSAVTSTELGYVSGVTSAIQTQLNSKQGTITTGNLTGTGISITGGTGSVIGTGTSLALPTQHDIWVDRNGDDTTGNGTMTAPFQTVGKAITLVTSPSSTNNWSIHLMSGRHDAEVNDLILPPYTFIVGFGGPDVGSYLRLPSGKAIKLSSAWTANARGGIQSVYLGGGTSVNLDFVGIGSSAGSTFMLDDVFVTGTFTHTGRGVNGGDFVYAQNTFFFGAASFTGSELQSINSTWGSSITAINGSAIPCNLTFLGGSVGGAFGLTNSGGTTVSMTSTGTSYLSTFTTTGTLTLTVDNNLPIGYSLSGGTTRVNTTNALSAAYAPTTSSNWNSVPSLVGSGLDTLATSGIVKSQTQNQVLASPDGSSGVSSFRALAIADLPSSIPVNKLATVTASRALQSDGSGFVSASSVTSAELGYISGVTSAIQTQLGTKEATANKGVANGYASLDGSGRVPAAQMAINFIDNKGTWNASTNTPTLADGTGTSGDIYIVSVAGTQNLGSGSITYAVGDWVLYNGTIWQKVVNSNAVSSVNGATGVVTVNAINQLTGDVTAGPASGSASAVATIAAGAITNAKIAAAAAIDLSKLAAVTASRALQSDGSGFVSASTVTSTELGYVSGVTSAIQTQLGNKQPLNSNLTAVAGLAGTGFAVQTGAGTFANRTLVAGTNITITNPDGVAGNVTINSTATVSSFKTNWITADGTTKTVTHSLGTTDVMVTIYDLATNEQILIDSIVTTSTSVVTLTASVAPSASGYRVLVLAL